MRKEYSWRIVLASLLAIVLLLPASGQVQAATGDLVRFTIDNRTDSQIFLRLDSVEDNQLFYYFRVLGGSTAVYTPERGIYSYRLTSCGVTVWGELDLSRQRTWILPSCGLRGGPGTGALNTTDVSKITKLVRVELENDTGTTLVLRLSGPYKYIFTIATDETKVVSIIKGRYSFSHEACGFLRTGVLNAWPGKVRDFNCP